MNRWVLLGLSVVCSSSAMEFAGPNQPEYYYEEYPCPPSLSIYQPQLLFDAEGRPVTVAMMPVAPVIPMVPMSLPPQEPFPPSSLLNPNASPYTPAQDSNRDSSDFSVVNESFNESLDGIEEPATEAEFFDDERNDVTSASSSKFLSEEEAEAFRAERKKAKKLRLQEERQRKAAARSAAQRPRVAQKVMPSKQSKTKKKNKNYLGIALRVKAVATVAASADDQKSEQDEPVLKQSVASHKIPELTVFQKFERAREILDDAKKKNAPAIKLLEEVARHDPVTAEDQHQIMEAAYELAKLFDPNYARKAGVKKSATKALDYYDWGAEYGLRADRSKALLLYQQGSFDQAMTCYQRIEDTGATVDEIWNEAMLYFVNARTDVTKALSLFAQAEEMGGPSDAIRASFVKRFDETVARFLESEEAQVEDFPYYEKEEITANGWRFLYILGSLYLQDGPWRERGKKGWVVCSKKHKHAEPCKRYPFDLIKRAADYGDLSANLYLGTSDETGIPLARRMQFLHKAAARQGQMGMEHKIKFAQALERDARRGYMIPALSCLRDYVDEESRQPGILAAKLDFWEKKGPPFCLRLREDVPSQEVLEMLANSEKLTEATKTSWCAQALQAGSRMLLIATKGSPDPQSTEIHKLVAEMEELQKLHKLVPQLDSFMASVYGLVGHEYINGDDFKQAEFYLRRAAEMGNEESVLFLADFLNYTDGGQEACKQVTSLANAGVDRKLQAIAWLTYYYVKRKDIKEAKRHRKWYDRVLAEEHIPYKVAEKIINQVDVDLKHLKISRPEKYGKKPPAHRQKVHLKMIQDTSGQINSANEKFEQAQHAVHSSKLVEAAANLHDAVVNEQLILLLNTAENSDALWEQLHRTIEEIEVGIYLYSEEQQTEIAEQLKKIKEHILFDYNREDQSLKKKKSMGLALVTALNQYESLDDKKKTALLKKTIHPALMQLPELKEFRECIISPTKALSNEHIVCLRNAVKAYTKTCMEVQMNLDRHYRPSTALSQGTIRGAPSDTSHQHIKKLATQILMHIALYDEVDESDKSNLLTEHIYPCLKQLPEFHTAFKKVLSLDEEVEVKLSSIAALIEGRYGIQGCSRKDCVLHAYRASCAELALILISSLRKTPVSASEKTKAVLREQLNGQWDLKKIAQRIKYPSNDSDVSCAILEKLKSALMHYKTECEKKMSEQKSSPSNGITIMDRNAN